MITWILRLGSVLSHLYLSSCQVCDKIILHYLMFLSNLCVYQLNFSLIRDASAQFHCHNNVVFYCLYILNNLMALKVARMPL